MISGAVANAEGSWNADSVSRIGCVTAELMKRISADDSVWAISIPLLAR
jgi:hypothetical protein